jgi:hypothetical protein
VVNNSTNIIKTNNQLSPQIIQFKMHLKNQGINACLGDFAMPCKIMPIAIIAIATVVKLLATPTVDCSLDVDEQL